VKSFSGLRFVHLLVAAGALLVLVFLIPVQIGYLFFALIPAAALGYFIGKVEWRRIASRVDERNVVILYRVDSAFYVLLLLLFFADEILIGAIIGHVYYATKYPNLGWMVLWVVTGLLVGRNGALAVYSRRYELEYGALRPKWFYQRSVVGPEGMLNRTGFVVKDCNPEGTIKIGAVRWAAESIDGTPIPVGTTVIVRDIEGLRLIVARK
jgi:membrane protein implicated in regulation of membrane protease activity